MSEYSRGKDFTAAALSYWSRRLASESAPPAKAVRLARVVRAQRERGTQQNPVDGPQAESSSRCLVIEAGLFRIHVPELLECAGLEMVLAAVGRAAKAVGA